MRRFEEIHSIKTLHDYNTVIRSYNRLSKALIAYEATWLARWKVGLSDAVDGLRATLFVLNPDNNQLIVNYDER